MNNQQVSAQPKVLRFSRGWSYMRGTNGVEVWRLVDTSRRFRIRGSPALLERVLSTLRQGGEPGGGVRPVTEDLGITDAQMATLLDRLRSLGALLHGPRPIPSPPISQRALYDPQIEFFHGFERDGMDGHDFNLRLRERRVAVLGIGGYGCFITQLLARIGIRRIVAVDMDRVEISNLSRQVLYGREDLGRLKIEAAAKRVSEVDPEICYEGHDVYIKTPDDLVPLLEGVDLAFSPFGLLRSDTRDAIMRSAILANVPLFILGFTHFGPLIVPGQSPCYDCVLRQHGNLGELVGRIRVAWQPPPGNFAPPIALMCSYAVWEAARFLSGCDEPRTLGGMYTFNPLTYALTFWESVRQVDCTFCGEPQSVGESAPAAM